jgi:hypothetical protein
MGSALCDLHDDGIANEVVNVSSSGEDSPCDLSIFESDAGGSPCLGHDMVRKASCRLVRDMVRKASSRLVRAMIGSMLV